MRCLQRAARWLSRYLGRSPLAEDRCCLLIPEIHAFGCVAQAETGAGIQNYGLQHAIQQNCCRGMHGLTHACGASAGCRQAAFPYKTSCTNQGRSLRACAALLACQAMCVSQSGGTAVHGRSGAGACTETPKPWYSARRPPRRYVLARQSVRPWKSLWVPFPRSAARRVRA